MSKQLMVGIVFGGRSAEHSISIGSAKNILAHLDPGQYTPQLIGIDQTGKWCHLTTHAFSDLQHLPDATQYGVLSPCEALKGCDVIFPVLHGPFGEDGTIQGLMAMLDIPCVGCGVLSSAICMDKVICKQVLTSVGLPVVPWVSLQEYERNEIDLSKHVADLNFPLFVKPANMGSSVGITKVSHLSKLASAVDHALTYDSKILIEEGVVGREFECALLGEHFPEASCPGEVISGTDFYDFEAKYAGDSPARTEVPANITTAQSDDIRHMAQQAFVALNCQGLARVDFFLDENNHLWINEVNTLPGFIAISLYPKMWEVSGVTTTQLVDRLIQIAFR